MIWEVPLGGGRTASRTKATRGRAAAAAVEPIVDELERLRLERILSDWVTGLPLYPIADLRNEQDRLLDRMLGSHA